MRVRVGDELGDAVARCAEPCRGDGPPCPDLIGVHAGEKGLTWLGEPAKEDYPGMPVAERFPFRPLALQVARLAGLSEDELLFSLLPRCGSVREQRAADERAERCRRHWELRLRQLQTPPTVVTVGQRPLVQTLTAVAAISGREPVLAPFGTDEPLDGGTDDETPPAGRLARHYFRAGEFRVVPLPAELAAGVDGMPTGRWLVEFAGKVGRLCRVSLYDEALVKVRELAPLTFREKVDASGSTWFSPPGTKRLFRILRRPRQIAAEFYPPQSGTCYVYRGTDLDRFLSLVVEVLTQAIG